MLWQQWQQFIVIASPIMTAAIGVLVYKKGSNGDKALNLATNIQSVFTTQKDIIDSLKDDVRVCEGRCDILLKEMTGYRLIIEGLERQVANHAETIKIQETQIELLTRKR